MFELLLELLKDYFLPIILTVITIYFSVQLRFAKTKEELTQNAWLLIKKIIIFIYIGWLAYGLGKELVSDEQLTRAAVFTIVFNTLSLFTLSILFFIHKLIYLIDLSILEYVQQNSKILNTIEKLTDSHISHTKITEKFVDKLENK